MIMDFIDKHIGWIYLILIVIIVITALYGIFSSNGFRAYGY